MINNTTFRSITGKLRTCSAWFWPLANNVFYLWSLRRHSWVCWELRPLLCPIGKRTRGWKMSADRKDVSRKGCNISNFIEHRLHHRHKMLHHRQSHKLHDRLPWINHRDSYHGTKNPLNIALIFLFHSSNIRIILCQRPTLGPYKVHGRHSLTDNRWVGKKWPDVTVDGYD